ncbi:MAG TPA: hypothetical protein PLP05_12660, partial [Sedimentisphaerales bacterium]|nr:hypothetical protein [Sedimentisphaerales bacterium]
CQIAVLYCDLVEVTGIIYKYNDRPYVKKCLEISDDMMLKYVGHQNAYDWSGESIPGETIEQKIIRQEKIIEQFRVAINQFRYTLNYKFWENTYWDEDE